MAHVIWLALVGMLCCVMFSLPKDESTWRQHASLTRLFDSGSADLRAAVFGFSDGLVSNLGLILSVYMFGHDELVAVHKAGLSGLVAGATSMAAGEWISVSTERESQLRQVSLEREHLAVRSEQEKRELANALESLGVRADTALEAAEQVAQSADRGLGFHLRIEHGLDSDSVYRADGPYRAAASSFCSFALGALLPLLPWLPTFGADKKRVRLQVTLALSCAALAFVGAALSRLTPNDAAFMATRQLVAGGVTALSGVFLGWLLE